MNRLVVPVFRVAGECPPCSTAMVDRFQIKTDSLQVCFAFELNAIAFEPIYTRYM
jgi:hypothetical protein